MNKTNVDVELTRVAAFLRKPAQVKVNECVMAEKRVDVFKGSVATRALLSPAYSKLHKVPTVETLEEAHAVMQDMLNAGLILRARPTTPNNNRFLQPDLTRTWSDEALYAWIYEGSQLGMILGSAALLLVVLACMLFPLWPIGIRMKASYLLNLAMYGAIGIVVFLLLLSVVRMIVYVVTVMLAKPGIWIFPNLWADCGVLESFQPVWDWDLPATPPSNSGKAASTPVAAAAEKKDN